MKPANIALIGCGAVSQLYYTPALQELEKNHVLAVKALVDPNPDSLTQLQKHFSNADCLHNLAELSADSIDLAIVASPPQFHAAQTIQLLQSGLSVLCEKPMAATVAEAEAMIEAAATASGLLAIGLFRRFLPATQTIHKILSLNLLGEIQSFHFSEGGIFRWPIQSPSYFRKATAQGGVLMDVGVHLLDLMIWWFGKPIEVFYEDDAMGGIEVNCRLKCQFAGFAGEVRLSRDCELPNRYVIRGKKGWLSWDVNDAPSSLQMGFEHSSLALNAQIHNVVSHSPVPTIGQPSFNFEQSFTSQICNVIAAMNGREKLAVSGEQAIVSLQLIESCYRDRTLMPMPWLRQPELVRARQLSTQG